MTADLHLHTRFSDGTETPQRVVELAAQAGLSIIAITDHDNVDAYPIAAAEASRRGLELIAGIEMSSALGGAEVHMLGYLFDPQHPGLREHLARQQARRVERLKEMVRKLQAAGLALTEQEVFANAGDGTVGRPHLARALLKRGYVQTMSEAFDRYLGEGGPGFVPGSTLTPKQVMQIIREAGGVPVLAHPIFLKDDTLIDAMARDGLAGVEVYHSSHTPELVQRYEQVAKRLKLLATGGSDYHGDHKEGLPVGSVKVPAALVEGLKQWAAGVR